MSFTPTEITEAGYSALDYHIRNKPIDQIGIEHPLLKKLQSMQKSFPGGKQYVTERIRKSYDSNMQWYRGDQTVTYNRKQTLNQTEWEWGSVHDGFFLDEDRLSQNGIELDDSARPGNYQQSEMVQLTNLFEEQMDSLRLGLEESFDLDLHRDGTQDTEAIDGLDTIVQAVATGSQTGTTGGVTRSASGGVWFNQASLDVAQANLIETMEQEWRKCHRNGGKVDFILAGSTAVDIFRAAAKSDLSRYVITGGREQTQFDPSVTGLAFHNVPVVWDPTFEDLDAADSPPQEWESRMYFINCRHLKLRPMRNQDMKARKPPRAYDRYVYYWGLTWKGVLTANKLKCHGVITVTGS